MRPGFVDEIVRREWGQKFEQCRCAGGRKIGIHGSKTSSGNPTRQRQCPITHFYLGFGWYLCSGAGHGGYGGAAYTNSVSGGATYDSSATPIINVSGGGGRIAICAPTNLFAGTTNVNSGDGANPGQGGAVFLSSVLNGLQIISQTPTGTVSSTVDSVNLSFNEAIDPASLSAATFSLNTPTGLVSAGSMNVAILNAATVQVSFPVQNLPGGLRDHRRDQHHEHLRPVARRTVHRHLYHCAANPRRHGHRHEWRPGRQCAGPARRRVDRHHDGCEWRLFHHGAARLDRFPDAVARQFNVRARHPFLHEPGQLTERSKFLIVPTSAPGLTTSVSGTSLMINWNGLAGVTYQTWWSTNLVDWSALGDPVSGTNGPMQIILPLSTGPADFFRIGASN